MPYELRDVAPPTSPVLIVALEGWIDAGLAATNAAAVLLSQIPTRTYAVFCGDELFDSQVRRAHIRVEDGVRTGLGWPEPRLRVGIDPAKPSVAFLVGPEPDRAWSSFVAEVVEVVTSLRAQLVVGLGGFPTAAPHTRPIQLAATASDADLANAVGYVPGALEVPIGVADVIGSACCEHGIASVGMWARVPHYVATMPFPAATLALLKGLRTMTGIAVDLSELEVNAKLGLARVDKIIADSKEHQDMVRELEEKFEESAVGLSGEGPLPSGEEIASELERFLRGETP